MENDFMNKIIKVQKELKAPKSKWNSFGSFHYRSTEDILEAAKPLLAEEGLLLRLTDEMVNIGDRYYVKATAIITDGYTKHETTAYAREQEKKSGMDESQITGSASTYARKYALNGLFCIDDTKDADTDEYMKESKKRAEKAAKEDKPTNKPSKPETPAEPIICPECGQKLKPEIKGKNRTYTAEEYMQMFGKCPECYIHEVAAKKNGDGK